MYTIETDDFQMVWKITVFEADVAFPENTSILIDLHSHGFSATTDLDIDVKELATFAEELLHLYDDLRGKATLREPYGYRDHIEFTADERGYIRVCGELHDKSEFVQSIIFKNSIEQTYLASFAKQLERDFALYRKKSHI